MSILGRLVVLTIFGSSLYWLVLGIASGVRDMREAKHPGGVSRRVKAVAIALSWMMLFLVRNILGWKAALVLLIAVSVLFGALLLLLGFVYRPAAEGLLSSLDSDEWVEWAVGFLFIGMAFAWFAFLLFAQFGVLCAISLRSCGVQ